MSKEKKETERLQERDKLLQEKIEISKWSDFFMNIQEETYADE